MSDQNALIELARQYGGGPVGAPLPDFKATNVPIDAPAASDARPSVSARAGVPAAGRGSQINPDQSMHGVELATTPLAHPTGIDAIDGLLSPAGLASLTAGGYGIARAGVAGGLAAGAKEAVATAAPALKYEAAKTILEKMGVPSPLAVTVAIAVSGYQKSAKPGTARAAAPSTVPPAGVETAQEALARQVATRPVVAPAAVPPTIGEAAAAPLSAAPAPPRPAGNTIAPAVTDAEQAVLDRARGNGLPDQKALNEAAIARRRAAYQASQAATTSAPAEAAPAWTPAKLKLTADETAVAQRLEAAGKTDQEIRDAIETARELKKRFGSPSAQEAAQELKRRAARTYPKGRMSGGGD